MHAPQREAMHDSSRVSVSLARRTPYEVTFEGGWGTSHYLGFPCLALCIVSLLAKEFLRQVAYQQAGMIFSTFPFEFVSPSFRFGPTGSCDGLHVGFSFSRTLYGALSSALQGTNSSTFQNLLTLSNSEVENYLRVYSF